MQPSQIVRQPSRDQVLGDGQKLRVAKGDDDAAGQPRHASSSSGCTDRCGSRWLRAGPATPVGLPGGQQGDVQPEPPPQLHGVPQFGVGAAHVGRIADDEEVIDHSRRSQFGSGEKVPSPFGRGAGGEGIE